MCLLSVSGILLWPGWRKLLNGFKIKLDGHPKRLYFDIHKVLGIVAQPYFIAFTGFTGFCWNFSDFTKPIIYAVTFTRKPASVPVSLSLLPGKTPVALVEQLKNCSCSVSSGNAGDDLLSSSTRRCFESSL